MQRCRKPNRHYVVLNLCLGQMFPHFVCSKMLQTLHNYQFFGTNVLVEIIRCIFLEPHFPPLNCACFYHALMGIYHQQKRQTGVDGLTADRQVSVKLTIFGSIFVPQVRWNVTSWIEEKKKSLPKCMKSGNISDYGYNCRFK